MFLCLPQKQRKVEKEGRPSHFYEGSDKVVQIQFPFRDYERLAELAMQSLVKFGEDKKLEKTSVKKPLTTICITKTLQVIFYL